MKLVFWASAFLVVYTYIGYAELVWLIARFRPRGVNKRQVWPKVSIVMAVHNAGDLLGTKLKNLSQLEYPKDLLEIIVASDGSSDCTAEILASAPNVKSVICPRIGKAEALNRALAFARNEIVVFTDVRQKIALDAIAQLAANFADEDIGCVSGELMFFTPVASRSGMSRYWGMEKRIRKCESASGSVVGATGALYAVRRQLIPPLPVGTLLDDVYIPLHVIHAGKRVIFEPSAQAWDAVCEAGSEFLRKIRTLAGNFQIVEQIPWTVFDRRLAFRFVSHKLMRLIAPWLLLLMLIASWKLSALSLYLAFALIQSAIYALAIFAAWNPSLSRLRLASTALTFALMNTAAICAAFLYLRYRKRPDRLWVAAARKNATHAGQAVAQEP